MGEMLSNDLSDVLIQNEMTGTSESETAAILRYSTGIVQTGRSNATDQRASHSDGLVSGVYGTRSKLLTMRWLCHVTALLSQQHG